MASFIANALQIDFESVLGISDNEGMVNMFKSLESTGVRGFLGCAAVFYASELEQFFDNAHVRNGEILSAVQGKFICISEDRFAGVFGLPTEGLTDLTKVPKDKIYDARNFFSESREPVIISKKKRQMKHEFRLLNDILAKSVFVKAGSFDAVTAERFRLMTAIHFGIKINWSKLLFDVLKEMVDRNSRRAKGYAAQICMLLKGDPALTLGDATEFPVKKILTDKSVRTYVATNITIDARDDDEDPTLADIAILKKKTASKKKASSSKDAEDEPMEIVADKVVEIQESKKRPATSDIPVEPHMVSVGSKALGSRRHLRGCVTEGSSLAGEVTVSQDTARRTGKMGRKEKKINVRSRGESAKNQPSGPRGVTFKAKKFAEDKAANTRQASLIRKLVDPETTKYFTEIANVIEGTEIDLEQRPVICGNALEEARGKELELATDYIISHTMQTLLEGCSVDQLCSFLQSSAKKFSHIAMDRSGSHVAETALKSLAMHLQDDDTYSLVLETLTALCQEIVVNVGDIMCNSYGSHVLRRLLCFCKGVSVDTPDFHSTKPSVVLAERLNLRSSKLEGNDLLQHQPFPDQLTFLISEMLNPLRVDISTIQLNQYSSLVLQTALKLLAGNEPELSRIIPILLGCCVDEDLERNLTEAGKRILHLVEENAFSHLMEVILAVSPDGLYNQIFTKVFKASLFKMSSHPYANFVVQALVSHSRSREHVKVIWEELGTKFKILFEIGKSGVVAALLAASQRLQMHEHECCQALSDAVHNADEPSESIIPRILFLDDYFSSNDKANWNWPNGARMQVLGSLILQSVFKFPIEYIKVYIVAIISLEGNHILEVSKDPIGNRVIESFLNSNASSKRKRKLIIKLQGHFGELSVHSSGSFIVDKCFTASNLSLRETIVSELLVVQTELSKTKQGPYLLKKLDVERFARHPEQWRSSQTSKVSTYKDFQAAFGSKETQSSRSSNFLADTSHKSQPETIKGMRNEIDSFFSSGSPFLAHQGSSKHKRSFNKQVTESKGFSKDGMDDSSFRRKTKKIKISK
ncbi:pumilio23 [Dorcoceras hygrometricum]|uniref:Pumilio23 n=1 Tax=Dorcoceras hygrometricum TaxID=472368 RepID=A0A2Z7CA02_9LAMI|nr:pumilio23 [Dorcoceras hygrometricum]